MRNENGKVSLFFLISLYYRLIISVDTAGPALKEAAAREYSLKEQYSALQSFAGIDFIPNRTKVRTVLVVHFFFSGHFFLLCTISCICNPRFVIFFTFKILKKKIRTISKKFEIFMFL